jgi:hypothetical protein
MPHPLSSNELEAANRAEATALLIRSGYRVYCTERTWSYEHRPAICCRSN